MGLSQMIKTEEEKKTKVSKLVFYAQSTGAVISGRLKKKKKKKKKEKKGR